VSEDEDTEQAVAKHSMADLSLYCRTKKHSLIFESVDARRDGRQTIWTERVTVAGTYVAEGHATSKKRARASAAQAIINSGVLTDMGEIE
jgi:dsRNA-specific ribonuclease